MENPEVSVEDLVTSASQIPGYWGWSSLWSPLVTTEQTQGNYSVIEQLMPNKSGPPPHVHDHADEVFYIIEGRLQLQVRDEIVTGEAGQLVRIPRGTPHGFVVDSTRARLLNLYVPGAIDFMISTLGTPASEPTLPPPGAEEPPSEERQAIFLQRAQELLTQSWANSTDLLSRFRDQEGRAGPGGPAR